MFWADCCRGFDFTSWDGDCGTCGSQFYCHVCSDHLYVPSHAPSPFSEYGDLILGQQVCFSLTFHSFPFLHHPMHFRRVQFQMWSPREELVLCLTRWWEHNPDIKSILYPTVLSFHQLGQGLIHITAFFLSSCFFYNLYHIIKHIIIKCFNWFSLICACWFDLLKFKLKAVLHSSCLLLGFTIAWNAGSVYTVNVLWRSLNSFWTQYYPREMS